MNELDTNYAPYAPVRSVLDVLKRRRDRGLPSPVTQETLVTIGIPAGNSPRTVQALRFLKLIDDEGNHTESMSKISRANSDEYAQVLAEIIRAAYHAVFTIVDPAKDGNVAVQDAFRQFIPQAQRDRMVTLFYGLCQEAELVPKQVRERKQTGRRRASAGRRPTPSTDQEHHEEETTPANETPRIDGPHLDYRLVSALMQQLPPDGKWTEQRRGRWIQAVTAAIDLVIEVIDENSEATSD